MCNTENSFTIYSLKIKKKFYINTFKNVCTFKNLSNISFFCNLYTL